MERQSPLLKRTVEKQNAPQNQKTQCTSVWNLSRAPRIKDNVLDKPARWAFFRGHSWWDSFSLCNDSPPVKHKPWMLEWQRMASQSYKIIQMRLTWSKCNPTIMYGFTASLCTASRKSTWPMSDKIVVKGGQSTPPVVITETTHMGRNACIFYCKEDWGVIKGYERGQRLLPHRW